MRLGLRMGLNSKHGGGSALDPDARLYIAAVETALGTPIATALPSATSNPKRIISDFIKAEKAASRWTLHKRIYLPIYNNSAASAVDMVSRTSGEFTLSGVTHAAGYVQGNGTSGYFDTGSSLSGVGGSNSSGSIWFIAPTRALSTFRQEGVNGGGSERFTLSVFGGDETWIHALPSSSSFVTLAFLSNPGITFGSTFASNNRFIKHLSGGSFVTATNTSTDTTSIPSGNVFFMARNNNNAGINGQHAERRGGYGFGLGLTQVQAEGFSVNLETLYECLTGIALP